MKKIYTLTICVLLVLTAKINAQCRFGNFPPVYTAISNLSSNFYVGSKYNLPITGTITGIGYKGNNTGAIMRLAIYTNSVNVPGNVVAYTNTVTVGSGNIVVPVVTQTSIPAGNYWILAVYSGFGNHVNYTNAAFTNTYVFGAYTPNAIPSNTIVWSSSTGQDFNYWAEFAGLANLNISGNTTICDGQSTNLTGNGAVTYAWSTGATTSVVSVSPNTSTTYTVVGSASGCSNTAVTSVIVNTLPTVTAVSSATSICPGYESATLTANGATTYSWNTGSSSSSIVVSASVTTTYTVTGTDGNNCKNTATIVQTVDPCVGIFENKGNKLAIKVYPNPSNNQFVVELNNGLNKVIELTDITGRLILSSASTSDNVIVNISNLTAGIYYVKVISNVNYEVIKVVKN